MHDQNNQPSRRRVSRRHAQLLAALLAFHLAAPATQMLAPKLTLFLLLPLYVIVLAAATMVMASNRSRTLIALLAAPMLAAVVAVASDDAPDRAPLIIAASTLPFLAYTAAVVLWSVLKPGIIDQARLLGSASVFILAAQAWASAYAALELLAPATFALPTGQPVTPSDLTYLSFATQTTLGYGDVTPQSPIARAFATLQATAGIFYMGVIVARFAGRLQLTEPDRKPAATGTREQLTEEP